MFLELSEILVCPRCRPGQGLIVMVTEMRDRRVLEGHLGCPECEVRYPIRGGVIDFGPESPSGEGVDAPGVPSLAGLTDRDEEAATEVAALLGLREPGGFVYLGAGLDSLAARVAALAPGTEILAAHRAGTGGEEEGVSRARGLAPGELPVLDGRLRGVALPSSAELDEAIRVLAPEGRLVIIGPEPDVRDRLRERSVEVLAGPGGGADATADGDPSGSTRALVAVRTR